MTRKKSIESKKPEGYCYACFRDDAIKDPNIKVGVMIAIEYGDDDRFSMVRVNWGPEAKWERPLDGAVEQHWYFSEEDTKELMLRTNTHTGQDLIQAIYDRFKKYAHDADSYITRWCETEGIEYIFCYYREMTEKMVRKLEIMRQR